MSRIIPVVVTIFGFALPPCICGPDERLQPAVTANQSKRTVGMTTEIRRKAGVACFRAIFNAGNPSVEDVDVKNRNELRQTKYNSLAAQKKAVSP